MSTAAEIPPTSRRFSPVQFLFNWIADLGEVTVGWIANLGDVALFSARTLSWLVTHLPRRETIIPAFYQIGVLSLPVVALTGTFIGMVLAVQSYAQFRGLGMEARMGAVINMTLVTELAAHFSCQRVSLGLRAGKHTEVQVLSHSAHFEHRSNLIRNIALAMDEAVDQDRVIVISPQGEATSAITLAHKELAGQVGNVSICTVPFTDKGEVIGALSLERDSGMPFDTASVRQIEQILAFLAHVMVLKRRDERALLVKLLHSLSDTGARVLGPGNMRLKLWVLASLALAGFFLVAEGTWRLTAEAVIEGSVQRTVAAPIDGYISEANFRAGDVVKQGDELGALDDRDLRLERLKWSTLRQQLLRESREAMAESDLAEVNIISARIEQADAELALLDEQLARVRLISPLDGIIIQGDLSQMLGTPVARGDVLFKVAPLDDYRIVLKLDEKDIAPVVPGQTGYLVLASMPEKNFKLEIRKITALSTAQEGGNHFRVEAGLVDAPLALRPGMEGIGKIEIGERNLLWIWTRDLVNWLRLQTWTWWY